MLGGYVWGGWRWEMRGSYGYISLYVCMRFLKIKEKTSKIKQRLCLRAEAMAQLGKCWPHKHEGLSLSPRICIQKARDQ